MYTYNAFVTKVYDGDTITCDIDLGFKVTLKDQKLRLFGVDTPELRGKDKESGLAARDFLRDKILEKDITVVTLKDKKGKYGRWLAKVYKDDTYINSLLLEYDHAKEYYG